MNCRRIYLFVVVCCWIYPQMLWCCIDAQYCRGSFAVPGTDWCNRSEQGSPFFLFLCLHLHILMALTKLWDWLLINNCTQVISKEKTEKDAEWYQHIIHSIYFYSQCVFALSFIPTVNTALLMEPMIKRDVKSYCLPLLFGLFCLVVHSHCEHMMRATS